jgi:hypothetical protein
VTNLKYALQDEDTLFLIMDLMLGGDLKFHLINAGRFTEKRLAGGQTHSESRRDHVVLCKTSCTYVASAAHRMFHLSLSFPLCV